MNCPFCEKNVDSNYVLIMGEAFHTSCYNEMMGELNDNFPIDTETENLYIVETFEGPDCPF